MASGLFQSAQCPPGPLPLSDWISLFLKLSYFTEKHIFHYLFTWSKKKSHTISTCWLFWAMLQWSCWHGYVIYMSAQRSEIPGWHGSSHFNCWAIATQLSIVCVLIQLPTNRVQGFSLCNFTSTDAPCEIISQCGFKLQCPCHYWCWTHFHIPAVCLYIFFFLKKKHLFSSLSHFYIRLLSFYWVMDSLCILDINHLLNKELTGEEGHKYLEF